MIRTTLAAATALTLTFSVGSFGAGAAFAQTTGTGLATPGNVQPSPTAPAATNGPAEGAPREANPDPWERFNRKSYNFSMQLDRAAIGPAARTYKRTVPQPVRTGVHNFIQNLNEPVVFVNDVLQLRLKSAAGTLCRFVGNSTIGVAGLFDFGARTGLPHHDNGFGVTMGRYGVPAGPYLYVPVLGPSTIRDGLGSGVDAVTDPLFYSRFPGDTAFGVVRTLVGGLDLRANVDDDLQNLQTTATDPYATIRSAYLQNKEAQIRGGDTQLQSLPDFPDEPGGAATPAPVGAPPPEAAPDTAAPPPMDGGAPDAGGVQMQAIPDNPASPPPPADAPPPSTNPV